VSVGGESGAGARTMEKSWVTAVRDQCERAQVPFFFKLWSGVRKKNAGRALDGRTYDSMPERSTAPVPSRSERDHLRRHAAALARRWVKHDGVAIVRRSVATRVTSPEA